LTPPNPDDVIEKTPGPISNIGIARAADDLFLLMLAVLLWYTYTDP
jgi:hypothetical protein